MTAGAVVSLTMFVYSVAVGCHSSMDVPPMAHGTRAIERLGKGLSSKSAFANISPGPTPDCFLQMHPASLSDCSDALHHGAL